MAHNKPREHWIKHITHLAIVDGDISLGELSSLLGEMWDDAYLKGVADEALTWDEGE